MNTQFFKALTVCALTFALAPLSFAQTGFTNKGTETGWDGTVGYGAGISTATPPVPYNGTALKQFLPISSGQHRTAKRAHGRGFLNQEWNYKFSMNAENLQALTNSGMGCWVYQNLIRDLSRTGPEAYKPIHALTYGNGRWTFIQYVGNHGSGAFETYDLGPTTGDNDRCIPWQIRVDYRTTTAGRIQIWKDTVKIKDIQGRPTWFANISSNYTTETGFEQYLPSGWSGTLASTTTYFDEIYIGRTVQPTAGTTSSGTS